MNWTVNTQFVTVITSNWYTQTEIFVMIYICNGIDSLTRLNDCFNFKIRSDSFNFRWNILAAFPANEKHWKCFPMAVASFLVCFKFFLLSIVFRRCSYSRTRKWRVFALKFINHFQGNVFWDLIFKSKSIRMLLDDLKTIFNFIFFVK